MNAVIDLLLTIAVGGVVVASLCHQRALRRWERALREYERILDECVQTCHRLEQAEARLADVAREQHPSNYPTPPSEGSPTS